RIGRHRAPASHLEPLARQLTLEGLARRGGLSFLAREEHEPRREPGPERDAALRGDGTQEALRLLQQQSAAIAGLAIGSDRPAVGETVERSDGGADQPVTRNVIETRDETKTAAVALVAVLKEAAGRSVHGENLWGRVRRRRTPSRPPRPATRAHTRNSFAQE